MRLWRFPLYAAGHSLPSPYDAAECTITLPVLNRKVLPVRHAAGISQSTALRLWLILLYGVLSSEMSFFFRSYAYFTDTDILKVCLSKSGKPDGIPPCPVLLRSVQIQIFLKQPYEKKQGRINYAALPTGHQVYAPPPDPWICRYPLPSCRYSGGLRPRTFSFYLSEGAWPY